MTTRANYKALMDLIESKRTQTENIEGIYSRALHFENTIETCYNEYIRPELMSFSPLNPHPLTPLFEEYRDRLLYDETDYDKWNFGDVLIRPSKMSLRAYYFEVLKFTFGVNLNWHSLKYTVKEFPIQNTLRMLFGFNTILSVYIKNFLFRK